MGLCPLNPLWDISHSKNTKTDNHFLLLSCRLRVCLKMKRPLDEDNKSVLEKRIWKNSEQLAKIVMTKEEKKNSRSGMRPK